MQEAPIHQSNIYGRIKFSQTIYEKGHARNIPVKVFQNLTGGFREEDFLRISPCPYRARSPHSTVMCMDGSKFREQFMKRVTQGTFLRNDFKIGPGVPDLKEDLPRNIPTNFGPNWPSILG